MTTAIQAETIGDRISARRRQLKRTQAYIALDAGVSKTFLCEIEAGKRQNIGSQILGKLAHTLECTTDYLIYGDDASKPMPCPFCGSTVHVKPHEVYGDMFAIECEQCVIEIRDADPSALVRRWNRRSKWS